MGWGSLDALGPLLRLASTYESKQGGIVFDYHASLQMSALPDRDVGVTRSLALYDRYVYDMYVCSNLGGTIRGRVSEDV